MEKKGKVGAPLGNSNRSIIDNLTDKEIEDIKHHYFEHLAKGYPIESYHYKISYKTMKKLIAKRPDIFTEEEMEMVQSQRYHHMISIGLGQAQGQIERGNAQAWKLLMYNMFGWKEKVETKQEISVEDQFRKAVLSQEATMKSETVDDGE